MFKNRISFFVQFNSTLIRSPYMPSESRYLDALLEFTLLEEQANFHNRLCGLLWQ